ncbi:MAG TPA: hypothetical protein GXZ50_03765 [Clostridia bacterium]|nr:hypothetical protein [Clostridia bacterium]
MQKIILILERKMLKYDYFCDKVTKVKKSLNLVQRCRQDYIRYLSLSCVSVA